MNIATKYAIFEIALWNAKTKTTDYREYAITVFDSESGDKMAWDAANSYAKRCLSRLAEGSTYTIEKV